MKKAIIFFVIVLFSSIIQAQDKTSDLFPNGSSTFSYADTLRGSNTPWRAWWDVIFYDLHVNIHIKDSSISGYNAITYRVTDTPYTGALAKLPGKPAVTEVSRGELQIDLMTPLQIDSVVQNGRSLNFRRKGNAFFVSLIQKQPIQTLQTITVYYHGHPRVAQQPPWDGGFVFVKDSLGHPWAATACQGVGASIWWPNKDYQGDEPDSQRVAITVPKGLMDVSNGRLRSKVDNNDGTTTYTWFVDNPINNYDVAVNVGKFAHFTGTYAGLEGPLTLNYYVLPYHLQQAKRQFQQARSMLECFEYWFGPFPWYKDGYKLVEAPFLGMEHQSCVAYGNHYENGYLGRDLSHTGWGLKWDFIIIHESAHEWWGNNITTKDLADMWVHEAFANYAEALYTEFLFGREAGDAYCRGTRKNILNDKPIIAPYGVNQEGSGDMYYKGGNMILCIREIINNDTTFRQILRGLNQTFRHQTVTGMQIQAYINRVSGIDFSKVFQQYLTTTRIPHFEYDIKKNTLYYRWSNVVPGFDMPLKVTLQEDTMNFIYPKEKWQSIPLDLDDKGDFRVSNNFYVKVTRARG